MINKVFLLVLSLIWSVTMEAQKLQLGELFNEGAVLQRNTNVEIWGNAKPSESVTITLQGKEFVAQSDASGRWKTTLDALKAGGPYLLTVTNSQETIRVNEIYVGEVWIAGGQSNMAWPLEKSNDSTIHIAKATNKNIRFMVVPVLTYEGDRASGDMKWRTATTQNVGPMSGVAYFFAKDLQERLGVPVGIICCYKGGSPADAWMSRKTLLSNPEHAPIVQAYENYMNGIGINKYEEIVVKYELDLKHYYDSVKAGFTQALRPVEPMGERNYKRPYGLYDNMLKRIMPYTAKGVIWYQGEANATRAEQYRTLFPALINEWRRDFKNPKMPFLFVQLANYDHPAYGVRPIWAELREAQLKTWQKDPLTAMVVTMDVGEKTTIHPTSKEPVGKRLAACAFQKAYGMDVPYSGPVFEKATFGKKEAALSFGFIYDGLKSDGALTGFTICGKDQRFVPAKAVIRDNQVIVSAESVDGPVAVRYNWSNWGDGNLCNSAGFPASPFRTDDFKMLTSGVKAPNYK